MATLVGTQSDFSKALKELVKLDYDAVEAYETAISKLENSDYKTHMESFKKDHERHIKEINELLVAHGKRKVESSDSKRLITVGKVKLSDMIGDDNSVLKAMLSNEEDTNKAYERMNGHEGKWEDAVKILERGFEDEKKHKEWIKTTLKRNAG